MDSQVNLEFNRSIWKGGNVYLNMDKDANTYYLTCNYCEKASNFTDFNEFLAHAREKHGHAVGTSSSTTVQDKKKIALVLHGKEETQDETSASVSQFSALPLHDLSLVKRECLLEIIELLNKCLCIWHKPTRLRTTRKERLCAYQLLLLKLRKYHPECGFRNVRSIVRQLITNYFSDHARSEVEQDEEDENDDDKCKVIQTVMEQLKFLAKSDTNDEEKLDINTDCSFCSRNFYTTNALWTHMVDAHIPQKTSDSYVPTVSCSSCTTVDYDELLHKSHISRTNNAILSTASIGGRRKRSTTMSCISDCDTDLFTENSESDWSVQPSQQKIRKSKRKCKRRRRHSSNHLTKKKKIIDLTSDTDVTDLDNDDCGSSTHFLNDYDDQFLEDFIDLYRQQECLWQMSSPSYRNKKMRNAAYDILLKKYHNDQDFDTANISKVKKLVKCLRNFYDQLKKPNANLYRSHIWKKLSFIEDGRSKSQTGIADGGVSDLYCNHCEKNFKRQKYFSNHQLQIHPPTECGDCLENFGNADDLKKHILCFHRTAVTCPLCKSSDVDWKSQQHLAEHFYNNTCRLCGQIFHDINNFQNHKSKCQANNRLKCWHCDAGFRGTVELRKHSIAKHNDERPFKCSCCEITFKYFAPLEKHRKIHKRLNQFKI